MKTYFLPTWGYNIISQSIVLTDFVKGNDLHLSSVFPIVYAVSGNRTMGNTDRYSALRVLP